MFTPLQRRNRLVSMCNSSANARSYASCGSSAGSPKEWDWVNDVLTKFANGGEKVDELVLSLLNFWSNFPLMGVVIKFFHRIDYDA